MIDWNFILNPDTADELTIDEPVGWSDIIFEIVRDKKYHGISIAYSANNIKLIGAGAAYLKQQYELYGIDAAVNIKIQAICDDEVQDEETFKLEFGRYQELCGDECSIEIGIEETSCFNLFRNNFDKKVDMKSAVAFDKITALENYAALFKNITIPGKAIMLIDHAATEPAITEELTEQVSWSAAQGEGVIWPAFQNLINGGFGSFVVSSIPEWISGGGGTFPPYLSTLPAMVNTTELLGDIQCDLQNVELSFRLKGQIVYAGIVNTDLIVKVFRLPAGLDPSVPGNWIQEYSNALMPQITTSGTYPFDLSATIPLTITQGDLIYFYVYVDFATTAVTVGDFEITQDIESFIKVEAEAMCEDSTADVNLVYETLARACESMTNKCMKIKSDYYGRTNSEPDAYANDGCGALKALLSGLYLRNAEVPQFFISMKELVDGLQCIDNIGFSLSNVTGQETMTIEPAREFYQDIEIMQVLDASKITKRVLADEHPGIIKSGYEKWEVESIGGLDEFNSTREHRLTIQNAKTTVDLVCKFIAGGYAIEITRQQSFAATGAADTKYDNDTFIICLDRLYDYDYIVEQGIPSGAANVFHPQTVVNFRISPLRNLMRWAKMFLGCYRDYTAADSKIIFVSGTGNFLAEGFMNDACSPEAMAVPENIDIEDGIFLDTEEAKPILRPESITFEYPMSLKDFKKIRANPYGYILHACGSTNQKAHIMKISYKPNAGTAAYELSNRYQ